MSKTKNKTVIKCNYKNIITNFGMANLLNWVTLSVQLEA